MRKYHKYVIIHFLSITLLHIPIHGDQKGARQSVLFDREFYQAVQSRSPLLRDSYFNNFRNRIIQATCVITKIDSVTRYRHTIRVTAKDTLAESLGLEITYFIFVADKKKIELLTPGSRMEFWGQLMTVTPLTSDRRRYIIDVLYESGSVLVD